MTSDNDSREKYGIVGGTDTVEQHRGAVDEEDEDDE
jgi:hypothetical protein